MESAAGTDAVLPGDEAAHARSRRDFVPRRRYRPGSRRDHARIRRHGRGIDLGDPQTAARHQDGARRARPRTHRHLLLGTDSDPSQQGRRRPVLAVVPRHPRKRCAAFDPGHRRPYEFPDDGRARHADLAGDEPTRFDNLEAMHLTEMAFKEAMRLKPPVPSIPRRAVRDFTFMGYDIPAGTMLAVNPLFTHHMPNIWPEPERFDPLRFTDEAQRNRHRFAWVPFGGGAHMCLGLHFAYMQAKCFARHFLQNLSVSLEPGYTPQWQMWPIPKPRDGLRVVIKPV